MRRIVFLGVATLCVFGCGGRTDLDDDNVGDGGVLLDVFVPTDGSSLKDGSVLVDTGLPLPDSSVPTDGSVIDGGSPGTPIECGTTSCDSATQVCCITFAGMALNEACTAPSGCMGITLTCSSAQNCQSGDVCCANITMMSQGSECEPMCMGGLTNPQLCATSAECPMGQMCRNSPFGYKICR
jgi:hypothetical protein